MRGIPVHRFICIRKIFRWLKIKFLILIIGSMLLSFVFLRGNHPDSNDTPWRFRTNGHASSSPSASHRTKRNTEAIVSLYTGDLFLSGIVVLGYTLHKFGATVQRDMILLIPEKAINNTHHLAMLKRMGWRLLYVKPMSFPDKVQARLADGLVKLYAWKLTQYNIIAVLDADTMLIDSIEEPFRLLRVNSSISLLAATNPSLYHDDKQEPNAMFNAGVLFFRPAIHHFDNLVTLSRNKSYYNLYLPQQNLFNNYFRYQWTNLSMAYNLQNNVNAKRTIWVDEQNRARIVHFAGGIKPWHR